MRVTFCWPSIVNGVGRLYGVGAAVCCCRLLLFFKTTQQRNLYQVSRDRFTTMRACYSIRTN